MHRNTLLLISILAVVAALLVGIRIGLTMRPPAPVAVSKVSPTASPTSAPTYTTYTDAACDVSLQYPTNLQILESTTSGTILADAKNPNGSIIILCQQDIPRVPLPPEKIESLVLTATNSASVSAKLYHDASAKDGTPIDKLIFTHPRSGLDVFIAGYGDVYQRIIASLTLL